MARTIRRKNGKYSHSWYCNSEAEFSRMTSVIEMEKWHPGAHRNMVAWYQRWTLDCKTYEDYVAKQTAQYHGEKRSGYYTPPSDYVNWAHNRPLRRKLKQQLHHALVNDTFDGIVFEPFIKDAGWYFF